MINKFLLPNGEEIDLSLIESIGVLSSVRSKKLTRLGYWSFTIYLKDGTTRQYSEDYSYYDWSKVKHKLEKVQEAIYISLGLDQKMT